MEVAQVFWCISPRLSDWAPGRPTQLTEEYVYVYLHVRVCVSVCGSSVQAGLSPTTITSIMEWTWCPVAASGDLGEYSAPAQSCCWCWRQVGPSLCPGRKRNLGKDKKKDSTSTTSDTPTLFPLLIEQFFCNQLVCFYCWSRIASNFFINATLLCFGLVCVNYTWMFLLFKIFSKIFSKMLKMNTSWRRKCSSSRSAVNRP